MELMETLQAIDVIQIIDSLKTTENITEYDGLNRIKDWVISQDNTEWDINRIRETIMTEAENLDRLHWKIFSLTQRSTK